MRKLLATASFWAGLQPALSPCRGRSARVRASEARDWSRPLRVHRRGGPAVGIRHRHGGFPNGIGHLLEFSLTDGRSCMTAAIDSWIDSFDISHGGRRGSVGGSSERTPQVIRGRIGPLMPGGIAAPVMIATVRVSGPNLGWLNLSRDGRYLFAGDAGSVINTHTRTSVAR
jgi:hypothetical protein